ncbi:MULTISPECIES: hypothetical protein [Mesorhizobium]|uniref:hypothetical protein n=1 Tax=Mesorhizobium TaxID=68287 RepID=UPI0007EDD127|nr:MULTISPECIES: hypothetical protein [Mesorhizobium]TPJ40437.1 hypothetical protein FJ437_26405 [Mesorhizobium sp. B2-6-6]ARP67184.1 hypothetical protein A9K65_030430 [Mesorhizobium sp. WSM1497]MCA0002764.1 hypothetical protein [Mesorhizobium sp. B264B2A]MCA0009085.1 hypothetical protein [Mesorhizobium sp. B264B1B]MCA0014518.1 hypothetical protein [Mesorhizobium sp. B294B1A1]
MDRDNKRARAAASSSQAREQAREPSTILSLTEGPLTQVAERLVTANPRDTARNLAGFKGLGKEARTAIRGTQPGQETELAKFERRGNQLGRSAVELTWKLTSELGYRPDNVALEQVRAVSNIANYLTPHMQDAVVNRIGNMDPASQALGALNVAPNFGKFNNENQSRILDQAVELMSDPNGNIRMVAQNAIIQAYHQMDPNQQAQAHAVPGLEPLLRQMPPPQHAEERHADLDAHIAGLEAAVHATGTQISYEQLQRGGLVGQAINRSYSQARADLQESTRNRDRGGR